MIFFSKWRFQLLDISIFNKIDNRFRKRLQNYRRIIEGNSSSLIWRNPRYSRTFRNIENQIVYFLVFFLSRAHCCIDYISWKKTESFVHHDISVNIHLFRLVAMTVSHTNNKTSAQYWQTRIWTRQLRNSAVSLEERRNKKDIEQYHLSI